MLTDPPGTIESLRIHNDRFYHHLCWKAVFAGTIAAIGIHLLLITLGVGAGLAMFSPTDDANPATKFSMGAAIIWSLCALVSLAFGGLIAGRFSHSFHSGFVHGILVWSLSLILTVLMLSMGTGMVMGGALKLLGGGIGAGGKAAASGISEAAKQNADRLSSFVDEAVQSIPTNAAPKASIRAKREVGFAVGKLFAPGNDIASPDNRTAAIKALTEYTQMSEADATQTVDEWIASYKRLTEELKQKAEVAAKNLSCAAIWSFFALLIGLLVTGFGGALGAKCAARQALRAGTQ